MQWIQQLVRRIQIEHQAICLTLLPSGIWSDKSTEATTCSIRIPTQLKRCGMAMRLVVRSGNAPKRQVDPTLLALLNKARDWFGRLSSGQADSILAIAKDAQVGSSYVTRVVHLAFLAPDIVRAIARGEHPPEFTAEVLRRQVPLPTDWHEQRRLLGFAPVDSP